MRKRNNYTLKRFSLAVKRTLRSIFKGIGFKLSVVFLLFSASVSLMILLPNYFDRVPVYSYLISELQLPIAYELSGKVEVVDLNNTVSNNNVEIYIGGYSTTADSNGEFRLKFSAPLTTEVYVTIRYTDPSGISTVATELVIFRSGTHDLKKEFIIYV